MKPTHKELLDELKATLKARKVASEERLMSTLRDDPAWAQSILSRHVRALDLKVGDIAVEIGKIEGAGADTETDLRLAAVELLRKI